MAIPQLPAGCSAYRLDTKPTKEAKGTKDAEKRPSGLKTVEALPRLQDASRLIDLDILSLTLAGA